MKRLFCIAVALLLLFACAASAHAADSYLTLNGFTFDLDEDGGAVIHDYDDRASDVIIPETLLGAAVVSIDAYAFYTDTAIVSVNFDQATRLTEIGDNAFNGCSSLTELALPSRVTLGFGAFQNCTGLVSLTLSDGVGEIPEQCFFNCTALTELIIPPSVTTIGARAFGGCDSLKSIRLPDTAEYIAPNAFEGVSDLTICCERGSYADLYAQENDIRVVYPDSRLRGDSDGDGTVTIMDATAIQRHLAHLTVSNPEIVVKYGDIDGNGLDIMDATRIQRFLARYDDPYHIGEPINE